MSKNMSKQFEKATNLTLGNVLQKVWTDAERSASSTKALVGEGGYYAPSHASALMAGLGVGIIEGGLGVVGTGLVFLGTDIAMIAQRTAKDDIVKAASYELMKKIWGEETAKNPGQMGEDVYNVFAGLFDGLGEKGFFHFTGAVIGASALTVAIPLLGTAKVTATVGVGAGALTVGAAEALAAVFKVGFEGVYEGANNSLSTAMGWNKEQLTDIEKNIKAVVDDFNSGLSTTSDHADLAGAFMKFHNSYITSTDLETNVHVLEWIKGIVDQNHPDSIMAEKINAHLGLRKTLLEMGEGEITAQQINDLARFKGEVDSPLHKNADVIIRNNLINNPQLAKRINDTLNAGAFNDISTAGVDTLANLNSFGRIVNEVDVLKVAIENLKASFERLATKINDADIETAIYNDGTLIGGVDTRSINQMLEALARTPGVTPDILRNAVADGMKSSGISAAHFEHTNARNVQRGLKQYFGGTGLGGRIIYSVAFKGSALITVAGGVSNNDPISMVVTGGTGKEVTSEAKMNETLSIITSVEKIKNGLFATVDVLNPATLATTLISSTNIGDVVSDTMLKAAEEFLLEVTKIRVVGNEALFGIIKNKVNLGNVVALTGPFDPADPTTHAVLDPLKGQITKVANLLKLLGEDNNLQEAILKELTALTNGITDPVEIKNLKNALLAIDPIGFVDGNKGHDNEDKYRVGLAKDLMVSAVQNRLEQIDKDAKTAGLNSDFTQVKTFTDAPKTVAAVQSLAKKAKESEATREEIINIAKSAAGFADPANIGAIMGSAIVRDAASEAEFKAAHAAFLSAHNNLLIVAATAVELALNPGGALVIGGSALGAWEADNVISHTQLSPKIPPTLGDFQTNLAVDSVISARIIVNEDIKNIMTNTDVTAISNEADQALNRANQAALDAKNALDYANQVLVERANANTVVVAPVRAAGTVMLDKAAQEALELAVRDAQQVLNEATKVKTAAQKFKDAADKRRDATVGIINSTNMVDFVTSIETAWTPALVGRINDALIANPAGLATLANDQAAIANVTATILAAKNSAAAAKLNPTEANVKDANQKAKDAFEATKTAAGIIAGLGYVDPTNGNATVHSGELKKIADSLSKAVIPTKSFEKKSGFIVVSNTAATLAELLKAPTATIEQDLAMFFALQKASLDAQTGLSLERKQEITKDLIAGAIAYLAQTPGKVAELANKAAFPDMQDSPQIAMAILTAARDHEGLSADEKAQLTKRVEEYPIISANTFRKMEPLNIGWQSFRVARPDMPKSTSNWTIVNKAITADGVMTRVGEPGIDQKMTFEGVANFTAIKGAGPSILETTIGGKDSIKIGFAAGDFLIENKQGELVATSASVKVVNTAIVPLKLENLEGEYFLETVLQKQKGDYVPTHYEAGDVTVRLMAANGEGNPPIEIAVQSASGWHITKPGYEAEAAIVAFNKKYDLDVGVNYNLTKADGLIEVVNKKVSISKGVIKSGEIGSKAAPFSKEAAPYRDNLWTNQKYFLGSYRIFPNFVRIAYEWKDPASATFELPRGENIGNKLFQARVTQYIDVLKSGRDMKGMSGNKVVNINLSGSNIDSLAPLIELQKALKEQGQTIGELDISGCNKLLNPTNKARLYAELTALGIAFTPIDKVEALKKQISDAKPGDEVIKISKVPELSIKELLEFAVMARTNPGDIKVQFANQKELLKPRLPAINSIVRLALDLNKENIVAFEKAVLGKGALAEAIKLIPGFDLKVFKDAAKATGTAITTATNQEAIDKAINEFQNKVIEMVGINPVALGVPFYKTVVKVTQSGADLQLTNDQRKADYLILQGKDGAPVTITKSMLTALKALPDLKGINLAECKFAESGKALGDNQITETQFKDEMKKAFESKGGIHFDHTHPSSTIQPTVVGRLVVNSNSIVASA